VLIGEPHWVRQHVTLVSGLIPQLHERGVAVLAMEFARRIDRALIDSILNATAYDERLARRVTMQGLVQWGYQEYVDLYRAAWQVNYTLPPGAPRFRILGLGGAPDYSVITKREDLDDPHLRRLALRGETEKDWATLRIDSVLAKNQKALVYSGTHHAFTKYAPPIVSDGKLVRTGGRRADEHRGSRDPHLPGARPHQLRPAGDGAGGRARGNRRLILQGGELADRGRRSQGDRAVLPRRGKRGRPELLRGGGAVGHSTCT
jgi:hypothetical protein